MEISRMSKGDWGKVVAFFDVKTQDNLNLKGFKLVKGTDGLFVGYPSVKKADGEYDTTVWTDKETKAKLHKLALDHFNSEPLQSNISDSAPDLVLNDELPF